jgi:hypothetical protein
MKRIKWVMGLMVCLITAAVVMVSPSSSAEAPAMMVGRIFYVEGDLLRYVPAEKDWVAVVRDAPFGAEDTLFSGSRGMAELIVPNGTWIRTGNSTQIQFITLDADLTEMDVASGVTRFYNKGSHTVIKAGSPFGYVLADPDSVFDFYVGEKSVEIVAIKGTVSFVHSPTEAKYDVAAGSPSILADRSQVSSGDGTVETDWDQWNTARENFWVAKARVRGQSAAFLPPSLQQEAYAFEENGRWERVPYEGTEQWFWRPTTVVVGWSPFTMGRWTDWYGDQTWIPAEPFGYVTHHYGNWVYTRNYWYWAPPVVSVRVGFPLLNLGFFWSPGRVSWIHSGIYVGWVPLAPRETYYAHRSWGGPHTVVVNNVNISRININVRNYSYVDHAIVVNQKNFFGRNNYRSVRETNIKPATIIKDYRAAPVVNNTVINNYTKNKQRFNYTNVAVKEKPHNSVLNRINQNVTIIHEGRKENAAVLQKRLKSIPEGKINRAARIEQPKVTNYIVPSREVNRPRADIKLPQRDIKSNGRGIPQVQPGQTGGPERVSPARLAPPEKARPERVMPARPAQPEQPRPERVVPAKPSPPEQARPERVQPLRPGQQEKPGQATELERVVPARPTKPEQPDAEPERVRQTKPDQQEQPHQPAEHERTKRQGPSRE